MVAEDAEKTLAAFFAWQEGHHDGVPTMLGVLFVLRNRVKAGWGSWVEVIKESGGVTEYADVREPGFVRMLQLVDSVYDDSRPDNLTGGALYYGEPGKIMPVKGNPTKIERTGKVGNTSFYL